MFCGRKVGSTSNEKMEGGCGPIPFLFKEGWLRLNKNIPFLRGADGVVSNFKQNKERYAGILGGDATFY